MVSSMRTRRWLRLLTATLAGFSALLAAAAVPASAGAKSSVPTNIDVSQRSTNESETAVAINPTNPKNIVIVSNVDVPAAGLFEAYTTDGGGTWTRRLIGDNDNLGAACCDPSLSWDSYGNLFLGYLYNTSNLVPVALSTDGGASFNLIANISKPTNQGPPAGERGRQTYRFTDQPTVTAAKGEVWIVFNGGGPMIATGAPVSGLGQVGSFIPNELIPGTNNCTYGDVAIGPSGQVMQVCTLTETGKGGGKLYVSVDPDGLGPAGFGSTTFVTDTHVGGFNFIPAQPDRSVDAEPGLAWDRTGGPHNGRVYLVYSFERQNGSSDLDTMIQHSDDQGVTWSAPIRVNSDTTTNSQFLPKIALDETTGNLAVTWYDARNDLGLGGPGDTDGVPNDDAQVWGAFSTDGVSFPNFQVSAGTSNSHDSGNGIDYGDYSGLAFYGGTAWPAWADNSNSAGTNPDGALHQLDIYTAQLGAP